MNDLLERTIGPQIAKKAACDPASPWVMADANQLELAILNLAINARDAMPEGGKLTISTSLPAVEASALGAQRFAAVSVCDTGSGIPPHLIDKVFDPFFTTKGVGKGTGLGLSQVFGIAEQSGGSARLTSTEGTGTTVTILLPLTEASAARSAPDVMRVLNGKAVGDVLVIDDDDAVRRFMVDSLMHLGYRVREAADGASGLQLLRAEAPDVLLVDFAMAEMTGLEVIGEAQKIEPGLPIILATGYAEIDPLHGATGVSRILRKPFRIDQLSDALRELLH